MAQSKIYIITSKLLVFPKIASLAILSLLLGCGSGLSGHTVGEDAGHTKVHVASSASIVSYGEEFTVSIRGLPDGYLLPAGSATFAGFSLNIPGTLGNPGEIPRSDDNQLITFTTKAHEATPSGLQALVVDVADRWLGSTEMSFHGANLVISETSVVANQTIAITGSEFTPSSIKNSEGLKGSHKITGVLPSGVFINETLLKPPHVVYPIDIGDSGNLSIDITIPEIAETQKSGRLSLRVADSNGRAATVPLNIANTSVVLSPLTAYPGDITEARGNGISASNPKLGIVRSVDVVYRYRVQSSRTKSYFIPMHLGRVPVNEDGSFVLEFNIPRQASIPSANEISFTPTWGPEIKIIHNIPTSGITVNPSQVYNSDPITVTVNGLPPDYKLPPGSLTMDQNTLTMPGHFKQKGVAPTTDSSGRVSYVTSIPMETPPGRQTLRFIEPGQGILNATVNVLTHNLVSTPKIVTLGGSVEISSSDFGRTKLNTSNDGRASKISGDNNSYVSLGGVKLRDPHIHYPIWIDRSGRFSFEMRLPVDGTQPTARSAEIELIDSLGRRGTARITYARPQVSVSPARSNRGSDKYVNGTGFPARAISDKLVYEADVHYAGELMTTERIDLSGSFETQFVVPQDAELNTTNLISIKVRGLEIEINKRHSIPDRHVSVQPKSASIDSEVRLTGAGFPSFSQVKVRIDGSWLVLLPKSFTDKYGNFQTSFTLPVDVRLGSRDVLVDVQNVYAFDSLIIVQ